MSEFTLQPLTPALLPAWQKLSAPFALLGRVIPTFDGNTWQLSEQLCPGGEKTFAAEPLDLTVSPAEAAHFLCMKQGEALGRISLSRGWNGWCVIEDIAVSPSARRCGVGRFLLRKALQWAAAQALYGLFAESQDNNIVACRFYAGCGFTLGGIDTLLYAALPEAGETALYWYLPLTPSETSLSI